ncbi:MAG: Six-hairpin glycosidase-like protein [Rhodanobacteraceae bacterium]
MAALALASGLTASPAAWHDRLALRGQQADMTVLPTGGYALHGSFGERTIPTSHSSTQTASPLFDGLFAMAQDDLAGDSVSAIHDSAYDHDKPIPCNCFVAGAKWPYVWTRDVSYSIDLGLWRYDAARARTSLLFKLSGMRAKGVPQGPASGRLYPMQDTGSGGSWPVSTDRIVWFLAARHLLDGTSIDGRTFADKVWRALTDTLAQDRVYTFDARLGLYRGETSFLDWREQTYPEWTKDNVVFIAQSFALSTNVLHYEALRLAARMATRRHDPRATRYAAHAGALKAAINQHFWRPDRGMYMSYIGGNGLPVEAYDLLGLSLAITSGVADAERARASLAHYSAWPAGSPVIWPERADQPIYHNRAIWPFVSAYALRAARKLDDPALIAFEVKSLMRGAALAGSNMENYSLITQATHVDDGKLGGPVVDSPRQLWSVAGYLDMVTEGVFGLEADGSVEPELPTSLVPMLFGERKQITLQLAGRRITLERPATLDGNLLVADTTKRAGSDTTVTLKAITVPAIPLRTNAPMYAPATPAEPTVARDGDTWRVHAARGRSVLYMNGRQFGSIGIEWTVPRQARLCFRVASVAGDGIESLPSQQTCVGDVASLTGDWPRTWSTPVGGRFRVWLDYDNDHGPINTGITAAAKRLIVRCGNAPARTFPLVMPHSVGKQASTFADFDVDAFGAHCTFALEQGFNMSDLAHFAHYTGGAGGSAGPLNEARVGVLHIATMATIVPPTVEPPAR